MSGPRLWEAAEKNDVADVRWCLARGDVVDSRGGAWESTPLMEAARHTDPTVLLLLLCEGADLEARDEDGHTALHRAALCGRARCARVLTSLGADINTVIHLRETPVMNAAEFNRAETVKILVEAGADLRLKDYRDHTALDLAKGEGNQKVVSVITEPTILNWGNSKLSDHGLKTKLDSLPHDQQYRVLLLNTNNISSLPDLTSYPQLCQLEVLNVSHNKLREVNDKHIPTSVRMIYVGHNNILSLSPQMESEWLRYYHWLFTNSPQTAKRKINLQDNQILTKTLLWDHADLTDADLLKKIEVLDKNYKCSVLLINNNKLTQPPDFNKYPQFSDLKVIDASHNQLTDVDDNHLPDTVKIVHLGDNNIQTMSPSLLTDWVNSCYGIISNEQKSAKLEIVLNNNPIAKTLLWDHADLTDADLLKKIEVLDKNYNCSVLLINNNKLTQLPDFNKYPQFSALKVIDASHNQLTDVDDKHLPDTVKIVHLVDNNIQDMSPTLLTDWVNSCYGIISNEQKPAKQEIILNNNPIAKTLLWDHADLTDADLLKKIEVLDKNYQCSVLLINNNKLTELPDFNKYPQFSDLKVIDASHNKLTDVDDKHLPDTVKIVHLVDNNIQDMSPTLLTDWVNSCYGIISNEQKPAKQEIILNNNPIAKTLLWDHADLTDADLLKKIEVLDKNYQCSVLLINNNKLTELPDFNKYPQLSDLKVIDASHNKLTDVDDKHLPDTVKIVHLGDNNIQTMSLSLLSDWVNSCYDIISNKQKSENQEIILNNNPIAKTLLWDHADLTDTDLLKKIEVLDTNYKCSVLLINNNKLTQLPDFNKYPQFSDLKVIDASHNQLTDVDDKHLPDTVKIVHLGDNNIQTMSPSLLTDWVNSCYGIISNEHKSAKLEIVLNNNPIAKTLLWDHADLTDADLLKKIEVLDKNYQCSVLIINNNKLTELPDFNKYPQLSDLKVIDASHNKLTDVDDKHLPDTVKIVHLGDNNIQTMSLSLLSDWVNSCYDIISNKQKSENQEIILNNNPIAKTLLWDHADLTDADLLKKIEVLDTNYKCSVLLINNNKLTQLPDFNKYPQFSDLKVIDASHNQLTDVDDKHLPDTVKIVHLGDNNIQTMSPSLLTDWVNSCYGIISNEQKSAKLEIVLNNNPIAKTLLWDHADLTDADLLKKIEVLDKNYNCSVLIINNNKLTQLPDFNKYPQFSDLKVIDASHNQLTDVDAQHLPDIVKIVHLVDNNIQAMSPSLLTDWVNSCYGIICNKQKSAKQEIILNNNPIAKTLLWDNADLTDADLLKKIEVLDKNYKCSVLIINNNKLTQLPDFNKYPQFSDLKVIDASHNQLTDVDAQHLSDTVKIVHLVDNNIQTMSPSLLTDWVNSCYGIISNEQKSAKQEIILNNNPIAKTLLWDHADLTDADLLKKIEVLDKSYKCSVLLINNNNLTQLPDFNKYPQFSDLKVIDASHNQLTDVDDNHLPDTVKIVHLGDNNIQTMSPRLMTDWVNCCYGIISNEQKSANQEIILNNNPIAKTLLWDHADLTDADLLKKIEVLDKSYKCSVLLINNNNLTQLPDFNKYPQFSDLKVIDASHNQLTDVDAQHLPDTVKIVHLGDNNIQTMSSNLLTDWVNSCYGIISNEQKSANQEIILNNNPIAKTLLWDHADLTDADLLKKIEVLDKNYKCSVLIINNNKLTQLPDLNKYPQFSDLKVIDASHNQLTDVDAQHLPDTVKIVHLVDNNIQAMSPSLLTDWVNSCYGIISNEQKSAKQEIILNNNPIAKTLLWDHADLTDADLLKKIEVLDKSHKCSVLLINNNNLTQLPDFNKYPQFSDLKVIDASHNQLTDVDDNHLPDTVKIVHLGDNNIQTMSPRLMTDWVNCCYGIISNEQKSANQEIILNNNPIAKTLLWDHADLTDADLLKKIEVLDKSYKCSVLLINNNNLTQLPDFNKYPQFSDLKVIDASHNQLTDVDAQHLPDTVKIVHLGDNNIQTMSSNLLTDWVNSCYGIISNEQKSANQEIILNNNPIAKTLLWDHADLTDADLLKKIEVLDKNYKCSVLIINNNKLTQLPDLNKYPQFSDLKVIDASHNQLTDVDAQHLPDTVKIIHLVDNNIQAMSPSLLTDWVNSCYGIISNEQKSAKQEIILNNNPIAKTLLWDHADLTDADLLKKIEVLDKNGRCSVLIINNNKLTQLPDFNKYPQFSDLKVIDASHNQLTDVDDKHLPDTVKIVNLGDNNIQTMSSSLVTNWLNSFYDTISNEQKSAKQEIILNNNPIGGRIINLWNKHGPDTFGFMPLNSVPLDKLPDLSQMTKVKKLILPNHNIKNIDITQLPATVEEVNLSNNEIEDLSGLKAMKSLKKLFMSNNKLHTIPEVPTYIVYIDLDNNLLRSLKNLSKMKKLKDLTVIENQIAVIFGLPSLLQSVHLKGNPIRILHRACFPSERVYNLLAEALTDKQIDGLQQPPPQIFRRGFRAVIQYYEQSNIRGLQNNSKNRMCLLGEATAGKTSLMQSLMSGVPCLTAEDDRTQVVDTHTWNITDQCSYQIFDQGGHPIYAITNMFFMSPYNKNLICHNIRDSSMEGTLDVLKRTMHLHPNSDIHFVLTKTDLLPNDVASRKMEQFQSELNTNFKKEIEVFEKLLSASNSNKLNTEVLEKLINGYRKKIKDSKYFLLSSKLYKGILELKQFLCELAERDIITLPDLWWKCYTHIDSLQLNVLGYKQFKQIFHCGRNTTQKLKKLFKRKTSRNDLLSCLQFYHDCGMALWFKDHPKLSSYIFHNLTYLIDIMKAVFHHQFEESLDYKNNMNLQKYFQQAEFQEAISAYQTQGLLSHKLLTYLWQEYKLNTDDQDMLLEIMKSFDICYPILDSPHDDFTQYFFPFFCKNLEMHPSIDHQNLAIVNDKTLTLLLECIFFNSIPQNLTEMFIVHLQRQAVENHYLGLRYAWEGGLLVIVGSLNIAIVSDKANSTLYLLVRGDVDVLFDMWAAFSSLYKSLCGLIAQWHGVIQSLHIPCLHCVLIGSNNPYWWLPAKVFPEKPCSLLHVSCEKEADSVIPAALITHVQTDKEKHLNAVKQYLQSKWKGMKSLESAEKTAPDLADLIQRRSHLQQIPDVPRKAMPRKQADNVKEDIKQDQMSDMQSAQPQGPKSLDGGIDSETIELLEQIPDEEGESDDNQEHQITKVLLHQPEPLEEISNQMKLLLQLQQNQEGRIVQQISQKISEDTELLARQNLALALNVKNQITSENIALSTQATQQNQTLFNEIVSEGAALADQAVTDTVIGSVETELQRIFITTQMGEGERAAAWQGEDASAIVFNCTDPVLSQCQQQLENYLEVDDHLLQKLFSYEIIDLNEKKCVESDRTELGKVKRVLWFVEEKGLAGSFIEALLECSEGGKNNAMGCLLKEVADKSSM